MNFGGLALMALGWCFVALPGSGLDDGSAVLLILLGAGCGVGGIMLCATSSPDIDPIFALGVGAIVGLIGGIIGGIISVNTYDFGFFGGFMTGFLIGGNIGVFTSGIIEGIRYIRDKKPVKG
jgi:hypothetical protein